MATPKNIARSVYTWLAQQGTCTTMEVAKAIRINRVQAEQALVQLREHSLLEQAVGDAEKWFARHGAADRKEAQERFDEYTKDTALAAQPRVEAALRAPRASKVELETDTREKWLQRAVPHLATILGRAVDATGKALVLPAKLQVSVGFVRNSKTAIGVCIDAQGSVDGETRNVLICPTLAEGIRVLDVLLHELIHACLGAKHGHDKVFAAAARACGLEGKPTHTVASVALLAELTAIYALLGEYPHVAVKPRPGITKPAPGKSEHMRLYSVNDETYIVNIKRAVYDELGAPKDPWGDEMVADKNAAKADEGEGEGEGEDGE